MVLIVPLGLTNLVVPILLPSTNLSLSTQEKVSKKSIKHSSLLLTMLAIEKGSLKNSLWLKKNLRDTISSCLQSHSSKIQTIMEARD